MLHVVVLLMLPAQAFSTVEGYFNKKFQKDCPCKIVMFHDSYFWVPKQKFLLGMNSATSTATLRKDSRKLSAGRKACVILALHKTIVYNLNVLVA